MPNVDKEVEKRLLGLWRYSCFRKQSGVGRLTTGLPSSPAFTQGS